MRKLMIGVIASGLLVIYCMCFNSSFRMADRKKLGEDKTNPPMSEVSSSTYSRGNMPTVPKQNTREGTETVSRLVSRERVERTYRMRVSGYSYTGRRTASGKTPSRGMCAIDRRHFKFGDKFYVPGYGFAVAEDTGGAIRGVAATKDKGVRNMDLFFETEAEADAWGIPVVEVVVYEQ